MVAASNYYILEYVGNGQGAPYFIDKYFTLELRDYDVFQHAPNPEDFEDSYALKGWVNELNADYLPEDNLVSADFLKLCNGLNVAYFSRRLSVILKKKKPAKSYNLFFL